MIDSPSGIQNAIDNTNLQDYVLSRDITRRVNVNRPSRFDGFVGLVALINLAFNVYESDGDEPQTYKQATKSKFWSQWYLCLLVHLWLIAGGFTN